MLHWQRKKYGSMEFDSKLSLKRFDLWLAEKLGNGGVRFDNIAGALQHLNEVLLVDWVKEVIHVTGIHKIMTSDGVFMNV